MALDPNIILQAGRVQTQIDNPMDIAAKAYSMRHLAAQSQMQERQLADDQAMRDAYAKNMQVGPDGRPTLNQQGVIADLAGQGRGMKAYEQQQQFGAQSLQQRQQQMQTIKDQSETAHMLAMSMQDPASYQVARQKGIEMGLPNADKLPQEFDPAFVKDLQFKTQSMKDQFDQHYKEQELAEKKTEHGLKHEENQIRRDELGNQRQNQALQQTQTMLESAKGNPEVSQALKDRLAAKKFESLVNLYGDPNKLDPTQVQLAATEVSKIASGGVPTNEELKHLTPSSIPMGLAKLAGAAMNNPQSAEAGEFIKRYSDYVKSLKKDAQETIYDKFHRVIDTRRKSLGEGNYKTLQSNYVNPINKQMFPNAPSIGSIEEGHQYLGGDPSDPGSWKATK